MLDTNIISDLIRNPRGKSREADRTGRRGQQSVCAEIILNQKPSARWRFNLSHRALALEKARSRQRSALDRPSILKATALSAGQNRVTSSDSAGLGRSSLGFDGVPIWMKPASFSSAFSPRDSSTSRSKANQPVSQQAP